MLARPRRSVLYMPGSNAKALAKAATLPADALILDLEDSVAPDAKETARAQVVAAVQGRFRRSRGRHPRQRAAYALGAGRSCRRRRRRPGRHSPAEGRRAGRDHARGPGDARERRAGQDPHLGDDGDAERDPERRLRSRRSPPTPPRVSPSLVMGLNDLAKETRARLTPGRPTMTAWLANCAVAARAHGIDIIDGVFNDIRDLDGFRAECLQGRDMGLDGKTLIHPGQIDICNEVFAPSAEEVATRPCDRRRLRLAGKRRQGRHSAQRQDGRAACTPTWRGAPSPSPTPSPA